MRLQYDVEVMMVTTIIMVMLTDFYDWNGQCLLRGTNAICTYNSG